MLLAAAPVRATDPLPEDQRLDADAFRSGLRERGLIDLLALYLREHPPGDAVEQRLAEREVKLAIHADRTRPDSERRQALADADTALQHLIEQHSDDPRALDWQMELARSLLYREAEPHVVNMVYRGGTADDRARVASLMDRADAVVERLLKVVQEESDRIDELPGPEFERLEESGYVERIDAIGPEAEYLLRWIRLYRAMARDRLDPRRREDLTWVLNDIERTREFLTTPQEITHLQCQSLLLAGMARRQIGDLPTAAHHLTEAVRLAEQVRDAGERKSLTPVVTTARLERIKALRDAGQYSQATNAVAEFRVFVSASAGENFGLRLAVALLEAGVHRAHADALQAVGEQARAMRERARAVRPLMDLARRDTAARAEVYAAVYQTIDRGADVSRLHPFVQGALIAGLLDDAERIQRRIDDHATSNSPTETATVTLSQEKNTALDRALRVAERLLRETPDLSDELRGEALYNLAVAQFRRGLLREAAQSFLEVARVHQDADRRYEAANIAVELASDLYGRGGASGSRESSELYLTALRTLTTDFSTTPGATYWQYYLGQTLDELGRYAEAARAYARVVAPHEHYLESRFRRVRALALALEEYVTGSVIDAAVVSRRVQEVMLASRNFLAMLARSSPADPTLAQEYRRLAARTKVIAAESQILPGVDRAQQALAGLEGFDARFAPGPDLAGRVLRVRLMALQSLGRFEEAQAIIPRYVKSDPANAGATLQSLFTTMRRKIERDRRSNRPSAAARGAQAALILAREIFAWSDRPEAQVSAPLRYTFQRQLAQACLDAGEYAESLELFEKCLTEPPSGSTDPQARFGYAESLYRLDRWKEALPRFNRLCREIAPTDELRWRALLRDLQCRTRLGEDPSGILQVIQQQRFLHADMGGPDLQRMFDALQRENERRRTRKS